MRHLIIKIMIIYMGSYQQVRNGILLCLHLKGFFVRAKVNTKLTLRNRPSKKIVIP
jgi:hypothetical protein